jgi:hypothetical protein
MEFINSTAYSYNASLIKTTLAGKFFRVNREVTWKYRPASSVTNR